MKTAKIKGINKVLSNLNKEIAGIKGRTKLGLRLAALTIKGKASEYTPWDTGNLVNSSFVMVTGDDVDPGGNFSGEDSARMSKDHRSGKGRSKTRTNRGNTLKAEVGYTAYYAVFVHEIDKAYRKPGSSWQFLAKAIIEEQGKVVQIIREEAEY
jgi:hypothetical protein